MTTDDADQPAAPTPLPQPAPPAYQSAIAAAPPWTAPAPRRRRRGLLLAGIATVCLLVGGGGGAFAVAAAAQLSPATASQPSDGSGTSGPLAGGSPRTFGGQDSSGSSATSDTTTATDAQQVGVVTILTTIDYGTGQAAGTGMILTADGEILTNNHVVEGATSIEVTVESTGAEYTAEVVGTDAVDDLAVLQLEDASGLTPVDLADTAAVVGDTITDVGNAGGTGTLVAATGTVTALDQQITVQDDETGAAKQLTGLIELDADVQSGDSGGPILDEDGDVVGIATAASSGSADVTGYAIPIATAETIVAQIEAGVESGNVEIGLPAFLGVQLSPSGGLSTGAGVAIAGTVDGSGAAAAGLAAGDTITAIDGTAVADSDALSAVIAQHEPGDRVAVTWTDSAGASHTATVTLGSGPAA